MKKSGLNGKEVTVHNNNKEAISTINKETSFRECVGDYGWENYKLWAEKKAFNHAKDIWYKDDSN